MSKPAAVWWKYPDGSMHQVVPPFYPASCDNCGWQGSSEKCGVDVGGDDSDVYCPVCHIAGADHGSAGERAVRVTSRGKPLTESPDATR